MSTPEPFVYRLPGGRTQPLHRTPGAGLGTALQPLSLFTPRNPLALISEYRPMAVDSRERARTQALCWLLDELFDAEDDLLALLDRGERVRGE